MISGTATLLTGGTVTNVNAIAADSDIVKIDVGPSNQGVFQQAAQRRTIGPGDVVIIPAGVYHGFDDVVGGIDYLAFRTDPNLSQMFNQLYIKAPSRANPGNAG